MNLIKTTIAAGGQKLSTPKYELPVPQSLRKVTEGKDGKKIVVGIRPENILDADRQTRGETTRVTAEVEIAEPLGHEVVVHAKLGDDLVVAKLEAHHIPRMGEKIELVLELDAIHLFDAETEKRLS
jgi:multiple sugar transport system ATP-binding protein